jgi:hypothetical protein
MIDDHAKSNSEKVERQLYDQTNQNRESLVQLQKYYERGFKEFCTAYDIEFKKKSLGRYPLQKVRDHLKDAEFFDRENVRWRAKVKHHEIVRESAQ